MDTHQRWSKLYLTIAFCTSCHFCTKNHVPATCVRVCMLFCSATSGSLYSRAWPASTSSSFTFTWFSRSLNNLQAQNRVSLHFNNSYFSKIYFYGLLFFESLKLFFQLQHLVKTFSSPPLTVLIIHVFTEDEIANIKLQLFCRFFN